MIETDCEAEFVEDAVRLDVLLSVLEDDELRVVVLLGVDVPDPDFVRAWLLLLDCVLLGLSVGLGESVEVRDMDCDWLTVAVRDAVLEEDFVPVGLRVSVDVGVCDSLEVDVWLLVCVSVALGDWDLVVVTLLLSEGDTVWLDVELPLGVGAHAVL